MIKICEGYSDFAYDTVISEQEVLDYNMYDDETYNRLINFYDNCYKRLGGTKNTKHNLGIIDCSKIDTGIFMKHLIKKRTLKGTYKTTLFNTNYEFIYENNEFDSIILKNVNEANNFAEHIKSFITKILTYCEELNTSWELLKIVDDKDTPHGIGTGQKPIFTHMGCKAYLIKLNNISYIHEIDSNKELLYFANEYTKEDFYICRKNGDFDIPQF